MKLNMSNKEELKDCIEKIQNADKETIDSLEGVHKTVAELIRDK